MHGVLTRSYPYVVLKPRPSSTSLTYSTCWSRKATALRLMAITMQDGQPPVYPDIYGFPPFFTRQPNEDTWAAQCANWSEFIRDYCRSRRLWRLHVTDALETDLFWNKEINRRLKLKDALAVLKHMKNEGQIEWDGPAETTAIIFWKKPEEWATSIYEWIDSTGQRNSVLTLYEISEGDLTTSQDFHKVDLHVLRKALDVLVKRGSAQVFGHGDEIGVKFF